MEEGGIERIPKGTQRGTPPDKLIWNHSILNSGVENLNISP